MVKQNGLSFGFLLHRLTSGLGSRSELLLSTKRLKRFNSLSVMPRPDGLGSITVEASDAPFVEAAFLLGSTLKEMLLSGGGKDAQSGMKNASI